MGSFGGAEGIVNPIFVENSLLLRKICHSYFLTANAF